MVNGIPTIYAIRCLVDGKRYIGQSQRVRDRRNYHWLHLNRGTHYNRHLQGAWAKYGENNFEFTIVEAVTEDVLDARERAWIEFHKTCDDSFGYNLETGGHFLKKHSAETRRKIGDAHRGKIVSQETRKRVSDAKKGKPSFERTPEYCAKLSKAHTGMKRSVEARAAMSSAQKHYFATHPKKVISEECKRKISIANTGRVRTPEVRARISATKRRLFAERQADLN